MTTKEKKKNQRLLSFSVTLHDIVHTEKSLTLVFEYLERDLKQYTHALFVVFSFISFFYLFRQWLALGPSKREGEGWLFLQKKKSTVVERLRKEGESLSIWYLASTQKTYLRQGLDVSKTFLRHVWWQNHWSTSTYPFYNNSHNSFLDLKHKYTFNNWVK